MGCLGVSPGTGALRVFSYGRKSHLRLVSALSRPFDPCISL